MPALAADGLKSRPQVFCEAGLGSMRKSRLAALNNTRQLLRYF